MQFVQLPALEATDNRPPPHPQGKQLSPPDHPMLPLGDPRHLMVKRSSVKLSTATVPKSTLSSHIAMLRRGDARVARTSCQVSQRTVPGLRSAGGGNFAPGSSPFESRLTV